MLSVSKTFLLEFDVDPESFSVEKVGSDGSAVRYSGPKEDFDPQELDDLSREPTPKESWASNILRKVSSVAPGFSTTYQNPPQAALGIRG